MHSISASVGAGAPVIELGGAAVGVLHQHLAGLKLTEVLTAVGQEVRAAGGMARGLPKQIQSNLVKINRG